MTKNEIQELRRRLNEMHKGGMKVVKEQQQRIAKLEKRAKDGDKINANYKKRIETLEKHVKNQHFCSPCRPPCRPRVAAVESAVLNHLKIIVRSSVFFCSRRMYFCAPKKQQRIEPCIQ